MKIAHYLNTLYLTGGTKVLAQHQEFLKEMGYEVAWYCQKIKTDFEFPVPITKVDDVSEISKAEIDILITNKPKDYFEADVIKVPHHVYLSQAYEVDHMNVRREKKKKLDKYNSFWGGLAMDFKWWLKKQRVHRMYRSASPKWAVSPYLMAVLQDYGCPLYLVRNSFDNNLYKCEKDKKPNRPLRILSVGDYSLSRKNLSCLFDAISADNKNFHLTRVSPEPMTTREKESGIVDEFHCRIPENDLAEIYRQTDILLSPSTDEGFGLPVIEAMACGALCILSTIGAYQRFADIDENAPKEYALFFDPHKPEELSSLFAEVTTNYGEYESIRQNGITLTSFYTQEQTKSDLQKAIDALELHS